MSLLILAATASPSMAASHGSAHTEGTALSAAEVKALITNNHLRGGFRAQNLTMAFFADGVIRGRLGGVGSDDGKWFMEGDNYCHHWITYFNGEKRCYRWYRNGDTYVLKNVDSFRTADIVGRIEPGIPKGY